MRGRNKQPAAACRSMRGGGGGGARGGAATYGTISASGHHHSALVSYYRHYNTRHSDTYFTESPATTLFSTFHEPAGDAKMSASGRAAACGVRGGSTHHHVALILRVPASHHPIVETYP